MIEILSASFFTIKYKWLGVRIMLYCIWYREKNKGYDAAVVGACWKLVESDIDEYEIWREVNGKIMDI